MAKGQLHSTGTICKAEIHCPIEDKGGQHFDSQEELIAHTVNRTGANPEELQDSLRSGVHLQEVVMMAKEGLFGSSISNSQISAPHWPGTVELDLKDKSALNEATDSRVRELSGRVIGYEADEFPVAGLKSWRAVTFNAEHDLQLSFMELDDGRKVAAVGYGPSAVEDERVWARWRRWDELLNEAELWNFASENEDYDHSKAEEILAVLRPAILD